MDITEWYAISLGCLAVLPIIARLFLSIPIVHIYGSFYLRENVRYPCIYRYLRRSGQVIRVDLLILVAFLVGNALCLAINVKGIPEFAKRSGVVSIINLIPLSLGANMNFIASLGGISLPAYAKLHRWLGRVAIIEGLIHAVSYHKLNLRTMPDVAALTAVIAFLLTLCSRPLRSRVYEAFSNLHLIFAAVAIWAIYLHIQSRTALKTPKLYLIAAASLQLFAAAVRLGQVLYRNVRYGKRVNQVSVRTITFNDSYERDTPVLDAVHVHVRLSRPWKPEAGQYVYLCIPGVSYTSFAQLHPFYISWWYRDDEHNDYVVFIVQRQRGFTKNLLLQAGNGFDDGPMLRAVIEGPYGKELKLDSYSAVLLFATGIGITGQLSYVEKLLDGYRNCKVNTRRIALFWEVEYIFQTAWVADRMQQLLEKQDAGRILNIHLFVRERVHSRRKGSSESIGERINITYDAIDSGGVNVGELIKAEILDRKAYTVVSLCTNDKTGSKIRKIVRGMSDETIHLKELDFRPTSSQEMSTLRTLFSALRDQFRRVKESVGTV